MAVWCKISARPAIHLTYGSGKISHAPVPKDEIVLSPPLRKQVFARLSAQKPELQRPAGVLLKPPVVCNKSQSEE
jgi:hypothetical protein